MKIVDVILVIISAIALVGAVFAAVAFLEVGTALTTLANDATTSQIDGVQQSVAVFDFILLFGWIWVLTVIVSSAAGIWFGIKRIRVKK